jgi:hypothetical protein
MHHQILDPIPDQLALFPSLDLPRVEPEKQAACHHSFLNLHQAWLHPDLLPPYVTHSPTVLRILDLLGPLDWDHFPERDLKQAFGFPPVPHAAMIAAELIKLNEGLRSLKQLHLFLSEHSGLISLLGFSPLHPLHFGFGFNTPPPASTLPTERHLTRMLRELPNASLQFLLADSVRLICDALSLRGVDAVGDVISLDTKHILAWVKQNNPKAWIEHRFDKNKQPAGDPDCRLGCKRRRNRPDALPMSIQTPARLPVTAKGVSMGEYYWGYGSGIVVTKVPGFGEFVIAELTQPFDHGDLTYFFPLMQQAEQRLGFRPRFGTFDAAFDAFYVYAYFYRTPAMSDGFAAVPFSERGGLSVTDRHFSPDGLPLCKAGLPMPLAFTFTDRTTCLVEHERGKYVCPLHPPGQTVNTCPVHHKRWRHGGCTALMPTSVGARMRYELDRDCALYKDTYNQRTAVERINAQAVALGIERPHLRNGQAIANQNTLIYLLINLRFLHRLHGLGPSA